MNSPAFAEIALVIAERCDDLALNHHSSANLGGSVVGTRITKSERSDQCRKTNLALAVADRIDLLQQSLPRTPDASYPVRIVDIDEPSIKAFGNWPWRRDLLARLIDKLFAAGVRVVVFDMVFPEPTGDALAQLPEPLRNSPE